MYTFQAIVAVITFFGFIPYLIWLILTIRAKKWKKLRIQIIVPVIFYTLLYLSSDLMAEISYNQYLKGIYGTKVDLEGPIYSDESPRSFNGDGASISVYELPQEVRNQFTSPDPDFLNNHPKKPSYRSDWKTQSWQEAPTKSNEDKYIDFALWAAFDRKDELKESLSRKGTFYSYFYYDHTSNPGNIDFYAVDLVEGKIYILNLNT